VSHLKAGFGRVGMIGVWLYQKPVELLVFEAHLDKMENLQGN